MFRIRSLMSEKFVLLKFVCTIKKFFSCREAWSVRFATIKMEEMVILWRRKRHRWAMMDRKSARRANRRKSSKDSWTISWRSNFLALQRGGPHTNTHARAHTQTHTIIGSVLAVDLTFRLFPVVVQNFSWWHHFCIPSQLIQLVRFWWIKRTLLFVVFNVGLVFLH